MGGSASWTSDDVPITVDSVSTGEVRHFDRLSEAVHDVGEARILGGVQP